MRYLAVVALFTCGAACSSQVGGKPGENEQDDDQLGGGDTFGDVDTTTDDDRPTDTDNGGDGAPGDNDTPPPPIGTAYYFSPDGNNANPGTEELPKRDLTGFAYNELATPASILFQAGGTWSNQTSLRVKNMDATADTPLVFGKYGTGADPILHFTDASITGFEFGDGFSDFELHGGYIIRDLELRHSSGEGDTWGIWFKGRVQHVTVERVTVRGFYTGMNAQGGHGSSDIVIRDSRITEVDGHGINGTFTRSTLQRITFTEFNAAGSGFVHAIYLSEGDGNAILDNTVLGEGPCSGGNITVHSGYTRYNPQDPGNPPAQARPIEGLTIARNTIRHGTGSTDTCWGISVNPYVGADPGGFNDLLIEDNYVENVGGCAVCVTAAPGAVVRRNRSRLTFNRAQDAISIRNNDEDAGDAAGPATVQNNIACREAGGTSGFVAPASSTMSGNESFTGAAATSGACAP